MQDDEYLAALRADKEKEIKAREEAEIRRLEEAAAKEAALQEQKHQEAAARRKILEEEVFSIGSIDTNLVFECKGVLK